MLGIFVGTLCLIALVKVLRHGGRGYGYGGGCGGGRRFGRHHRGGGCGHHDGFGPYRGCGHDHHHHDHGHDHHDHDHGHDHPDHGGGFRGRWGFGGPRRAIGWVLRDLRATPAQEEEILSALKGFREVGRAVRENAKGARKDLARALRTEAFDEVILGETTAKLEGHVDEMRKAFIAAFAKIHGVLDPKQRERLAEIMERGPGAFAFGGGRGWGER